MSNRVIKFRAWDKKNSVMRPQYGVLAKIEFDQQNKPSNIGIYEYVQINEDGDGDWDGFELPGEEFELMQFTGLTDKNGVEIYEGDVIEIELSPVRAFTDGNTDIFRIEIYYGQDAAFHGRRLDSRNELYSVGFGGSAVVRKEVIGNIFEHPELLESP